MEWAESFLVGTILVFFMYNYARLIMDMVINVIPDHGSLTSLLTLGASELYLDHSYIALNASCPFLESKTSSLKQFVGV